MQFFYVTGNSRGMFAVRYPDEMIFLVDFQLLDSLKHDGKKSISRADMTTYGRTLESWLEELKVTRTGDRDGCGDWI